MRKQKITYQQSGVNYSAMDPVKKLAQQAAAKTTKNLMQFDMHSVDSTRGESAYVWEEKDSYRAFVIEGLGTKNLVADAMRSITKKTYYDAIAQDTVAAIINDLIIVGAAPQVITAYFAVGNSDWLTDEQRYKDLVDGWAHACNLAGVTWGGGETPTLKNIIEPHAIDLGGSAVGIIQPKERLVTSEKLQDGDRIILLDSNGIHANGLTLARTIADELPKGYATKLSDGQMYGEALLAPTHLYAKFVQDVFAAGVDIHYMVNVTGHGWRKLMRAKEEFTYFIEKVPQPQELFNFIQKHSGNSDEEMYGNFNMGAGFALYVKLSDVKKVLETAEKHSFTAINAGEVRKGRKQVVIKPKNITFSADTLDLR